jgi:glycosyltransferase involved in cell wall biosynthesis
LNRQSVNPAVDLTAQPNQPVLSVVTPVFNGADTVACCIESISALRSPQIEHIIVDGGSRDGTVEIIRERAGPSTRWLSEADAGVYDAMNKGVSLARGSWILFLGADDIAVRSLTEMFTHLRNPNSIYYGDALMPHRRRIYNGRFGTYKLLLDNICHQAILYPAALLRRHRYDNKYPIMADYALNLRLYGANRHSFVYVPIVTAVHTDSGGISSTAVDRAFVQDKAMLVREYFPRRWYLLYRLHKAAARFLDAARLREPILNALRR